MGRFEFTTVSQLIASAFRNDLLLKTHLILPPNIDKRLL
jgi:hypothetical protein